eukprot:1025310-Amphidinium_carterae.2
MQAHDVITAVEIRAPLVKRIATGIHYHLQLCRTLVLSLGVYPWRTGLAISGIEKVEQMVAASIRAGPRTWLPTNVLQNMNAFGWSTSLPLLLALTIALQALCALQRRRILNEADLSMVERDSSCQHVGINVVFEQSPI